MKQIPNNILDKFESEWKSKRIKIIDQNHPHRNNTGVIDGLEYFEIFGYALSVTLDNGWKCRVITNYKNDLKFTISITN